MCSSEGRLSWSPQRIPCTVFVVSRGSLDAAATRLAHIGLPTEALRCVTDPLLIVLRVPHQFENYSAVPATGNVAHAADIAADCAKPALEIALVSAW